MRRIGDIKGHCGASRFILAQKPASNRVCKFLILLGPGSKLWIAHKQMNIEHSCSTNLPS